MKFRLFILGGITAFAMTSLVQAQTSDPETAPDTGKKMGWHQHNHGLWKELNLTDQQKQEIRSLKESNQVSFRSLLAKCLSDRLALEKAIAQNPSNEGLIRTLSSALATDETNLTVQKAQVTAEMKGILNQTQLQTWSQIQQRRQDWLQKRIDHLTAASGNQ
ncbi:MAG: Spy/CpxP family protein refolding chaperone [Verrucomicrobia bacterium]|nr:Spy/CpxP family protein refolding chaperone [Verrucomicrobiota bacterium]